MKTGDGVPVSAPRLAACVAGGAAVGVAFALFTTSRWDDDVPTHVWPAEVEYAYVVVALLILAWMARSHRTSLYPVASVVVACGVYHLAIGVAKQSL